MKTHHPARARLVTSLRDVMTRFDDQSNDIKRQGLQAAAQLPLACDATLARWHELLLFMAAHPANARLARGVDAEFARIAAFLKSCRGEHGDALDGEGLPWVDTVSRFSHDCDRWLLAHPHCTVALDSFENPTLDMNAVLRLTLPSLERNETTASLSNEALFDALKVKPAPTAQLAFLVQELSRLDAQPYVKDHLFDALDAYVRVTPTHRQLSKAYNRLPLAAPVFYQTELLRKFDPRQVMDTPLPKPRELSPAARDQAVQVLKNTMLLTSRETDPATYLDASSLRIYDLERGLSCAIFGMTPERQLPLESYVGFTLFKNGLPVAYGGSWITAHRAAFGMNIFEPYRGGESGYMMCQVLRTYRHAFGVRYFEVDATQFGLDNPDGIATGAYWFYWRHGYRSLTPELRALADKERARINATPGFRSSEKTLLRFTEANIALNFGGDVPVHLYDVTTRVTHMVAQAYGGNRPAAEADCMARFAQAAGLRQRLNADERRALAEVALIWHTLKVADADGLRALARMVKTKPTDVYAYQRALLAFFATDRL